MKSRPFHFLPAHLLLLLLFPATIACTAAENATPRLQVGADQVDVIVQHTAGKKVGLVANQAALLSNAQQTFLPDTLLARGVEIIRFFSPEHGFRGTADAGASISSSVDETTGIPIVSLYGSHRKPTAQDLQGLDVVLFDLQDVGVRFFTYISTLYYVMQACAENDIPVIILDRPNPLDAVDGPVMKDKKFRSFVSMFPIPAVHGITMGELGRMINGEGWLGSELTASLTVIPLIGWAHGDHYSLPVPPSPNLRSDRAILLYPTLCYIEGTNWSEGRGTDAPFEQTGYPDPRLGSHTFTPRSTFGASAPKHQDQLCYGPDLHAYDLQPGINLDILVDIAARCRTHELEFITRPDFFDLLAGQDTLRQQLLNGTSAQEIRDSWAADLDEYHRIRARYLLYPDTRYPLQP